MSASLYNSWLVGWILQRLDNQVHELGFAQAMKKSILSRTKLKVVNRKLIETTIKNEPAIVISNHPSQSEVLLILGLIEQREDAYLVADHSFLHLLPHIDKHIIPVYINHRLVKKQKDQWKFKLLTHFHQSECYSQEIAHQKNIASIKLAAEKVNAGGLVIIFPAAGENHDQFMNGLGYMIQNLAQPQKTKLVMAHVKGTSTLDYLRLIPGLKHILPTITFRFAKPLTVAKFKDQDPKITTKKIEKKYYQWTGHQN